MNADLEKTLEELGPDYRAVVSHLLSARTAEPEVSRPAVYPFLGLSRKLVAATLLFTLGAFAVHFATHPVRTAPASVPYRLALSPTPDHIAEIVRTQSPDGSWQSDYLTRQNAAALRGLPDASIAYRRAVRYLRAKGLEPLTDGELEALSARS